MTRNVRDLRELICVSRLTFCESDDEERNFSSDEEALSGDLDNLSISSGDTTSGIPKLKSHGSLDFTRGHRHASPDSGCVTNGSTPPELPPDEFDEPITPVTSPSFMPPEALTYIPTPPSPARMTTKIAGNVRRKKKRERRKVLETVPSRHDLPKPTRLPPVNSQLLSGFSSPEYDVDMESFPEIKGKGNSGLPSHDGNFDHILCYMDATVVSNWLGRANVSVNELTTFCNSGNNFVTFAHFWLTDFQDFQKVELFEMEHNILSEELGFAFAVGKDQGHVTHRHIFSLIKALFREYPGKLLSAQGAHMFLNYLDVLSSQKHTEYKKMLSDVKCSTRNKQHAQWVLATRSFALVSVWSAILNFYRNLLGITAIRTPCTHPASAKETNHMRFGQAIRLGHVDVVHYLLSEGHVNPHYVDNQGRTYVFTAVMHSQNDVLKYLLHTVSILDLLLMI